MKNLENIIFACVFYDYGKFTKLPGNVFDELKKYYDVLEELYNKKVTITKDFFCEILREKKIDHERFLEAIESLVNEDENFEYYLEKYLYYNQQKNFEVTLQLYKNGVINDKEFEDRILNRTQITTKQESLYDIYSDQDFEKPVETVDLGLSFFAREKGFRKGELILIGARPSVGKSSIMKQLAINCVNNNYKCDIYTLEMPKKKLAKDIISTIAGISKLKYDLNEIGNFEKEKIEKVKQQKEKAKNIIIDECFGIEIDKLCRKIKESKSDVFLIDYFQIIRCYGMDKRGEREKFNYIADRLQETSRQIHKPIIAFAQLGRKAEERDHPRISDLKETGKSEENADIIILLSLQKFVDEQTKTECILRCNVGKNRNGATGIFFMHFDRVTGKIEDTINYDGGVV